MKKKQSTEPLFIWICIVTAVIGLFLFCVDAFAAVVLVPFALFFYYIPTFCAISNNKENSVAIGVLNTLVGWTGLGFIICLVWGLRKDDQQQQVIIQNAPSPSALPPTQTLEQKLTELLSLKDKGLITEDEYSAKRSKLIS